MQPDSRSILVASFLVPRSSPATSRKAHHDFAESSLTCASLFGVTKAAAVGDNKERVGSTALLPQLVRSLNNNSENTTNYRKVDAVGGEGGSTFDDYTDLLSEGSEIVKIIKVEGIPDFGLTTTYLLENGITQRRHITLNPLAILMLISRTVS